MAQIYRKSIANVGLSVGGVIISEGGGDGEWVSVTSPERAGSKGGVHGDVVFYDMPNSIYEVTISLLETANANSQLQTLYNAQVDGTTTGTIDFSLEDIGTTELLSGQALFIKEPDRNKQAEVQSYIWTLHVASVTPFQYSERSVVV